MSPNRELVPHIVYVCSIRSLSRNLRFERNVLGQWDWFGITVDREKDGRRRGGEQVAKHCCLWEGWTGLCLSTVTELIALIFLSLCFFFLADPRPLSRGPCRGPLLALAVTVPTGLDPLYLTQSNKKTQWVTGFPTWGLWPIARLRLGFRTRGLV